MRTVHKFLVPFFNPSGREQDVIAVPWQAKVVLVGSDPRTHEPAIWLEVITEQAGEAGARRFAAFPTGDPIPAGWQHVGSFLSTGGKYVWHVYEQVQR